MLDGVSCYENPKISMTILLLLGMLMTSDFCYTSNANWRRQWHPTPVLLLGKSHGWRSLVSCSRSTGSLRVGHDWTTLISHFTFHALEKEMATHSSVLASRIPGMGEPGGLPSMGLHRVRHDWSDLAAAAAATPAMPQWALGIISMCVVCKDFSELFLEGKKLPYTMYNHSLWKLENSFFYFKKILESSCVNLPQPPTLFNFYTSSTTFMMIRFFKILCL